MQTIYVDFETYYSADYSLSKMQTDAYIKDSRFEVIGVSVGVMDAKPVWYTGSMLEIAGWLHSTFDWGNSAVCCHNTLFDGFILAHHFGIKPKLWMDTLAMARMIWPYLPSHSLANIAKHLKLQDKGTEVANAMGLRKADMSPQFLASYAAYCVGDTEICRDISRATQPLVPAIELKQIDMIVRMFTEPQFHGDIELLKQQYVTEVERKRELLEKAELQKDIIMSNDKFAEHLRNLGVVPPTKVSAKTGKVAFAFAKTDKEFQALLEDDNEEVVAAVSARLGVKTTIAETRVLRMVEMAERGPLPVYLNFWGAKTTGRLSGGNGLNWQNLPARGPSAGIRKGIIAPEGYKILVGDSSNIELRVAMAAAGQDDVVHKLASGIDLYCDFASKLFGRVVTKADKKERMLGKIAMLSLQYGAGWVKFKEMVRIQSGDILPDDTARRIVDLYRAVHGNVMDLHRYCNDVILPDIAQGCSLLPVDRHAWAITSNEGYGTAAQPGVKYHNLRQELMMRDGRQELTWVYTMGREKVKIYGGKVVENLCQYLAGRIVMWQTARFNQRYPVALSVHDEVVCVVRDDQLAEAQAYLEECLSLAPPWCRGTIPLACETDFGQSYGDAK
jgi:DNA polymerase